jgi:S-adenosylmethionine hydrolase
MGIITLISDWGYKDYFTAAVKGVIYKSLPEAHVVDITHNIEPFNVDEAAYVLRNAYPNFPDGTVHLIALNTEESINHPHSVAFFKNQYFIGTDNGIFSLIFDGKPDKMVELDIHIESTHITFSTRDRFVKAAVHLIKGGKIEDLGETREKMTDKMHFEPGIDQDFIRGMIIHVDPYENLVTNIPRKLFEETVKNKKFTISFRSDNVSKISDSYGDVRPGELVALFSSNDMLEIAINKGKASSLLGLKTKDAILITF